MQRTPVPREFQADEAAATERQLNFIETLRKERELGQDHQDWIDDQLSKGIAKSKASKIIEHLLARPKLQAIREAENAPRVPDGRYALREDEDTLNPIRFYRVNTGKDGTRWAGFQFVDRYASDDRYPVRGKERYRVLEAIAADPKSAAILYGKETNHCAICGKKLTRVESRELGIGPVCATMAGW